jgi:uncharacterized protein
MNNMNKKLQDLEAWFNQHSHQVIVAFSGGVDSCLVTFLARKFLGKENTLAVISASPSLKQSDLIIGKKFCEDYDIILEIIETKEIDDPNYYTNPVNRCYFCKTSLYSELQELARNLSVTEIINGQNYDDYSDYRPGIKAANNFQVRSPLADCKLTKNDVRDIAQHFNLSTWDKPASPCLSSRIPYGEEVTIEKLRKIEAAENLLNEFGFKEVRVRNYNNSAKIEVPYDRIEDLTKVKEEIKNKIIKIGFSACDIDSEGLISGKLNRVLT